jgi:hypothetical protein
MKILFAILMTGLGTILLISSLPWWFCGAVAFVACLVFRLNAGQAFLAGLIGVGLAWGISAGMIDARNDSVLSERIGQLFGGIPPVVVVILTAVIGGLAGGFGGLTGGTLSKLMTTKSG